jgi:hypothetical protein
MNSKREAFLGFNGGESTLINYIDGKKFIWAGTDKAFKNAITGKSITIKQKSKWLCEVLLLKRADFYLAYNQLRDEIDDEQSDDKDFQDYDVVISFTDKLNNSIAFLGSDFWCSVPVRNAITEPS